MIALSYNNLLKYQSFHTPGFIINVFFFYYYNKDFITMIFICINLLSCFSVVTRKLVSIY